MKKDSEENATWEVHKPETEQYKAFEELRFALLKFQKEKKPGEKIPTSDTMSRDERFDDMNRHVYHPKFMKKEGGGKWDFQLVSKRVEVAMPVTAGDDDELTTASHGINCRTI